MSDGGKDGFSQPSMQDDTCMAILNRLDELKGLALQAGDDELADGLSYVFEAFITRYCDSKHAELNLRIHKHFQPSKVSLN